MTYALVTGGSSGIGKAISLELAKRGHHIACVALPNSGQEELRNDLSKLGNIQLKSLELNLNSETAVAEIVNWINQEDLNIQVLVNNAGMGYASSYSELDSSFISMLLNLNIKTTALLTNALIPHLKKHDKAFILNLASAAAFYSMPYKSIYAASKRFVLDFSTSLREELRSINIGVTAVCPAGVITSEEVRKRIESAAGIAKRSALTPEEVAEKAVKAMLKRKAYIVPGKLARLMSWGRFVVPPFKQRKMIARKFERTFGKESE